MLVLLGGCAIHPGRALRQVEKRRFDVAARVLTRGLTRDSTHAGLHYVASRYFAAPNHARTDLD
ncbi:MAG: hypothetical protein WBA12_15665, partial [Catalinimonas sp.]